MRSCELRSNSRSSQGPQLDPSDVASTSRAHPQRGYQETPASLNSNRNFVGSQELPSLDTPNLSGSRQENQSGSNEFYNMFSENSSDQESIRHILRTNSQDLLEVKLNYGRQEVSLKNTLDSFAIQIQSLRNWGNSIAQDNEYLRGEVQRISEEYNAYYHSQAAQQTETMDLRAQLDAYGARAREVKRKVIQLNHSIHSEILRKLAEISELCPDQ